MHNKYAYSAAGAHSLGHLDCLSLATDLCLLAVWDRRVSCYYFNRSVQIAVEKHVSHFLAVPEPPQPLLRLLIMTIIVIVCFVLFLI